MTEDPTGAEELLTVVTEPGCVAVAVGFTMLTGGMVTAGALVELDDVGTAAGLDVASATVEVDLVLLLDTTGVVLGYSADGEVLATAEDEVDDP